MNRAKDQFETSYKYWLERRTKKEPEREGEKFDHHIGCYSWPNCKDAPLGCVVRMGDDTEPYGYRGL